MIKIIGTSHISPESLREIDIVIAEVKPDCVAVELDPNRFEALRRGEKINLSAVKYIGFGNYLVAKILSMIQGYLGKKTGVMPGEEMMEAVHMGSKSGADIALIDRDIRITLNRMKRMPLREKIQVFLSFFRRVRVEEKFDINKVPAEKMVEQFMGYLKELSPTLYSALISERDLHMARVLVELSKRYERIVVVVGLGHKKGITRELEKLGEGLKNKAALKSKKKKEGKGTK